ncbi:MAG: ABC transporter permease [Burkholderiales bacterium]|nr:ABC transporter permease [Burkholderiales bacterium]
MSAGLAIAWAVLGGAFGSHRGRLALSVLAIALGVALGFAVALINEAAIAEFSGGMRSLSGSADLVVRGPRNGFDEALYPRLARDPDIAVASPVVEVDARIAGRDDALRVYGVDAFRAAAVTPALVGTTKDALDLLRPGTVFMSPAAAAWLDVHPGATLRVQSGTHALPLAVAGYVRAESGERFAVMDIAAAQDAFARIGSLSRIDLRLRPGGDAAALRERIVAALPAGLEVATPDDNAALTRRLSRSYRVNLNVLALVALFTGGLLVFSTQALSIVRRRSQFALLRTLGLSRTRLIALLVGEGALVGAAGSLAGLAGGYLLADAVLRVFGADLGAGFFRGVAPDVAFDIRAAAIFAMLGIVAALLGSYLPAREAAAATPAAALKAGDEQHAFARLRSPLPGAVLLTAGAAAAWLPPVGGLPLFGYGAIALLLFGTLLLLPRIAAWVLAAMPRPHAIAPALALEQLRGAPGQAGVSLATTVASVSLMVSMAIMVASFRQSLDDWLLRVLPANVYVRAAAAGDSAYFSVDEQRRLASIDAVARIAFLRTQGIVLEDGQPHVTLLARDLPAADPSAALPLVGTALSLRAGDPPPVYVSEAIVDLYGIRPGARLHLPLDGKQRNFVVAGVWRDYARQQGALVIDRSEYTRITGDATATDAAVWLAPDVTVDEFRRQVDARMPGAARMSIATPGEIRVRSLRIFDRTFAVTYALLAAAIVIGLFGLSSSIGALVLARRREFGMLRHLGLTRRQIAVMLATEGFAVSSIGLAVGLLLGFLMSLILIHVVNRQSFHWGMTLHLPWGSLAALVLALLALALATTVVSARQAMGHDAIRAVKDDW